MKSDLIFIDHVVWYLISLKVVLYLALVLITWLNLLVNIDHVV